MPFVQVVGVAYVVWCHDVSVRFTVAEHPRSTPYLPLFVGPPCLQTDRAMVASRVDCAVLDRGEWRRDARGVVSTTVSRLSDQAFDLGILIFAQVRRHRCGLISRV
jgi:hypothetical protein